MAYGSDNPGDESDYFNDGPKSEPQDKQKEGMEETGLLPKALMAGKDFKPGDEIVLKITAVHEKDFEVEYASEEKGEEEHKGGEEEMPSEGMRQPGGGGGGTESESMMY